MDTGKQRILDAAVQCFSEKGFGATSMSEIARAASTSKASVFHHFETKENLYKEVIALNYENARKVWESVNERPAGDIKADLKQILKGVLEFQKEDPAPMKIAIWESLHANAPVDEENTNSIESYFSTIYSVLENRGKNNKKNRNSTQPEEMAVSIFAYALFYPIVGLAIKDHVNLPFLQSEEAFVDWIVEKLV